MPVIFNQVGGPMVVVGLLLLMILLTWRDETDDQRCPRRIVAVASRRSGDAPT
jgi:hypothetical protein